MDCDHAAAKRAKTSALAKRTEETVCRFLHLPAARCACRICHLDCGQCADRRGYGSVRGVSIEPEYNFGAGRSVQVELGRFVDRNGEQTGQEGEVEFKQLFNYIGSDGWAWGVSAAAGVERTQAEGTVRHLNVKLPVSIALGAHGYLHLNPGLALTSGSRRAFNQSAAIEKRLFERTMAFAEFARERELRFGQIGARYWLKREKLALDFALQQQRIEGRRSSGFILGLGAYDF